MRGGESPTDAIDAHPESEALQRYARLSGFLYLLVMVAFVAPIPVLGAIAVPGDFGATAVNAASSELLYRLALASQLVGALAVVVLAWALYVLLRSVHRELALLALLFRAAEGILIAPAIAVSFARLANYTGAADPVAGRLLSDLYRASFDIYLVFWSVGSAIFFYLMYRARVIPRALAAYALAGVVFGSVTVVAWGPLLAPEQAAAAPVWVWVLLFPTEVLTGLWLLLRGTTVGRRHSR